MGLFQKNNAEEPDLLFYSVRMVRLLSDPRQDQIATGIWHADAIFYPGAEKEITVDFITDSAPGPHIDDYVWVVYRGKWEALMATGTVVIGRVSDSLSISRNKWEYMVNLAQLAGDSVSGCYETFSQEDTYSALNLCELENLETGMMGNGINLDGFVPSGTNEDYLAPVPNGTLVLMEGFSVGDIPIFLFQFQNQYCCPFASHFVAETKDPITGPDVSTALTINNRDWKIGNNTIYVKCPLLRGGNNAETIDRGTKVIVSYNIRTREWEIIEAQCPAETNSSSNSGSG